MCEVNLNLNFFESRNTNVITTLLDIDNFNGVLSESQYTWVKGFNERAHGGFVRKLSGVDNFKAYILPKVTSLSFERLQITPTKNSNSFSVEGSNDTLKFNLEDKQVLYQLCVEKLNDIEQDVPDNEIEMEAGLEENGIQKALAIEPANSSSSGPLKAATNFLGKIGEFFSQKEKVPEKGSNGVILNAPEVVNVTTPPNVLPQNNTKNKPPTNVEPVVETPPPATNVESAVETPPMEQEVETPPAPMETPPAPMETPSMEQEVETPPESSMEPAVETPPVPIETPSMEQEVETPPVTSMEQEVETPPVTSMEQEVETPSTPSMEPQQESTPMESVVDTINNNDDNNNNNQKGGNRIEDTIDENFQIGKVQLIGGKNSIKRNRVHSRNHSLHR